MIPYDFLFFSCHPVRGVRIYRRKEQTSPCGKKEAPAAMQIHRRITGDNKTAHSLSKIAVRTGVKVIPAGFEPTACRLGGDRSILLSYGTIFSKVLVFQGFRGIGDCSPWSFRGIFANQEGRFLISFSNFGGRTFSHLLILTSGSRVIGVTAISGQFRIWPDFSFQKKR